MFEALETLLGGLEVAPEISVFDPEFVDGHGSNLQPVKQRKKDHDLIEHARRHVNLVRFRRDQDAVWRIKETGWETPAEPVRSYVGK